MGWDQKKECPVCSKNAEVRSLDALDQVYDVDCPRCGNFRITEEAIDVVQEPKRHGEVFKISAYLRERTIAQQSKVTVVSSRLITGNIKGAAISVDDILTSFPKTVSERIDRSLKNLYQLSSYPGKRTPLDAEKDYPVFFAENKEAFDFLRRTLGGGGWIEIDERPRVPAITLTSQGWNRIAELEQQKAGKDSRQAFVAMWFDGGLDKVYREGFAKAIVSEGYEPYRADLEEHNGKIDDEIIATIRKSRFMVADCTGNRPGVYFEAGFAKGLGIPVIWTCRRDDKEIEKMSFDTRQYNHILWTDEADLYEKLRRRIGAKDWG